jgi:malate dehydrogenase (oxaloacetate-decarboxylating)(NADP+)
MQADTAVVPELIDELYPFSNLKDGANVLIFPDLQSANVAFKLLHRLGGAQAIGPILMGLDRPVQLLQQSSEVEDVVYMSAISVLGAQEAEAKQVFESEASMSDDPVVAMTT